MFCGNVLILAVIIHNHKYTKTKPSTALNQQNNALSQRKQQLTQ